MITTLLVILYVVPLIGCMAVLLILAQQLDRIQSSISHPNIPRIGIPVALRVIAFIPIINIAMCLFIGFLCYNGNRLERFLPRKKL